jgi:hypothetical protein
MMTKIILGNHSAVIVSQKDRDAIRKFYCGVLGCKISREAGQSAAGASGSMLRKDDFQLGDDFHIAFLYGDVADESEFLRGGRSIYLEIKSDNVAELRQNIIDSGVKVLDVPDPHLYFQAPGGQVFRLVGTTEDLSKYERDN